MGSGFGRSSTGVATLAISGGTGTASVTLRNFTRTPAILVVPHEVDEAAGATYAFTLQTKDGFTISVASSTYADGDIEVRWVAVEKG